MDLRSSDNNRSDLTIQMPSSFVAGAAAAALAAAATAAAQDQPSSKPLLKLSTNNNNNGRTTPTLTTAAAAGTGTGTGALVTTAEGCTEISKPAAAGGEGVIKKPVRYRECMKNHAAGIGGHALDGCGDFMPCKEDPTSLQCSACGCHRNFHRREVEGEKIIPCDMCRQDDGAAAAGGHGTPRGSSRPASHGGGGGGMKKRFRTKFSTEQKERMFVLSEKLGWRIQKHDEGEVAQFCADTGVKRHVLKVWMHNNKHNFGNKQPHQHSS